MDDKAEIIEMTTDIVSAYVAHNPVPVADLPKLIERVHSVLLEIDSTGTVEEKPDLSALSDFCQMLLASNAFLYVE